MYAVEYAGFNDGMPNEYGRYNTEEHALSSLIECRKDNPKVKWRAIKIIENFA
jgi:hypothetical protein